jgi:hypothetical protein
MEFSRNYCKDIADMVKNNPAFSLALARQAGTLSAIGFATFLLNPWVIRS